MPDRRTFVLADLHWVRRSPNALTRDLAALVRAHPGARFIVAGDLLDRSAERPPVPPLNEAFDAHPIARDALSEHITRGGELWLAAGNHDAELGETSTAEELARVLRLSREAEPRLRTTPWFFRLGGLHVEHGHRFDPDNAPAHPLTGGPSLGVHFVRSFIARTGADVFLNANDGTPLRLLWTAIRDFGLRAPYVIYRFLHTAATGLWMSGRRPHAKTRGELERAAEAMFASTAGVSCETLAALAKTGARPTLASPSKTFARLYLDRVAATMAMGVGAGWAATQHVEGVFLAGAGAAAMMTSWGLGHDRYGGSVAGRLEAGAARIAKLTDASLVVLGHAHRECDAPGYANTGSFGFPGAGPGRPYLEIVREGAHLRAVRHWVKS